MIETGIGHSAAAIGLILTLSACTNPYNPVQRMAGGGLIGAGSGAAIGAAAAGGPGAALGAAVGGAVGALAGLVTTPPPPPYHASYYHRHYGYNYRHYAHYNHRHYASNSGRTNHAAANTVTAASTSSPSGL
jgi:hypothetical protein